jgi:hypothetical protein
MTTLACKSPSAQHHAELERPTSLRRLGPALQARVAALWVGGRPGELGVSSARRLPGGFGRAPAGKGARPFDGRVHLAKEPLFALNLRLPAAFDVLDRFPQGGQDFGAGATGSIVPILQRVGTGHIGERNQCPANVNCWDAVCGQKRKRAEGRPGSRRIARQWHGPPICIAGIGPLGPSSLDLRRHGMECVSAHPDPFRSRRPAERVPRRMGRACLPARKGLSRWYHPPAGPKPQLSDEPSARHAVAVAGPSASNLVTPFPHAGEWPTRRGDHIANGAPLALGCSPPRPLLERAGGTLW